MINKDLDDLYQKLAQCVCAEDLFIKITGKNAEVLTKKIKEHYRKLAKIAHPDRYQDAEEKEVAEEAFIALHQLYNSALQKVSTGTYGKNVDDSSSFFIETAKRPYFINETIAEGDLATVYGGHCRGGEDAGQVAIKVAEDSQDNDLLKCELRILKLLHSEASTYSKHLPILLDEFKTTQGQVGIVMRKIDGYDFYSIRDKYPEGIPQNHVIWIFRRALSVLGYAHSKGIIHGNIEPAHIMVRPRDHNVYLIDWCYAIYKPATTGQGFKCINEDYSPPEVGEGKPPIPASDLYSLGKCMVYLLGGDINSLEMPASVDDKIQRFIKFFCRSSPLQRAQDAWQMYGELDRLRKEVFGSHKFIEFIM